MRREVPGSQVVDELTLQVPTTTRCMITHVRSVLGLAAFRPTKSDPEDPCFLKNAWFSADFWLKVRVNSSAEPEIYESLDTSMRFRLLSPHSFEFAGFFFTCFRTQE